VRLRPLGERQLKDIDRPEAIFELVIDEVAEVAAEVAGELEAPVEDAAEPPTDARPSPFGEIVKDARQQIESRVLAQLKESLGGGFPFGPAASPDPPTRGGAGRTMTREIARLDRLRRSGALTDAQYERAVDRLLDGGPQGDSG
jgi:hypothetical protein